MEVFYEERWLTEPQYESAQSQLLLDSQKAEFEWLEKEKLAAQQAERRKEEERAKKRSAKKEEEERAALEKVRRFENWPRWPHTEPRVPTARGDRQKALWQAGVHARQRPNAYRREQPR